MRTFPALLLLLATATASASTAVRIAPRDRDHATMSFVLTTKSQSPEEIIVPVTIPDDMVITGLTIRIGREERLVARPLLPRYARRAYAEVVSELRDPALLEATDRGIQLSVFPITRNTPARVTLELTAIDRLDGRPRLGPRTSFVAAPIAFEDYEPYADYWPAHRWPSEEVAVRD